MNNKAKKRKEKSIKFLQENNMPTIIFFATLIMAVKYQELGINNNLRYFLIGIMWLSAVNLVLEWTKIIFKMYKKLITENK